LRVGQKAEVTLPTLGHRRLAAAVSRFAAVLDPATRTLRAEIDVPNQDRSLVAGIEARATVDFGARQTLMVPADALVSEGSAAFVFVLEGGRARKRSITVGYDEGPRVEIASGVKAGAELLIGARSLLTDGDEVEVER
jgi:RND family efflux transporter MFP subunit